MDRLSNDIKEFLEKTSTKTFLVVARQFIDLLEIEDLDTQTFLRQAHVALIDLYSGGHKLEQIDLKYSGADSDFGDKDEEFFRNKNAGLISTIGKDCFYWEVFDPTYFETKDESNTNLSTTDKEPTQGWLVDDFADVYRDLKIELTKIGKIGTDEAVEDALWQLKWSFINHWGQHCINALRVFHYLSYDGKQT